MDWFITAGVICIAGAHISSHLGIFQRQVSRDYGARAFHCYDDVRIVGNLSSHRFANSNIIFIPITLLVCLCVGAA